MSIVEASSVQTGNAAAASAAQESKSVRIDMQAVQRRVATPGADKPLDVQQVLINIGLLMMQSPGHRYFFLADLEWLLYPPVQLHQFKLYMKGGRPVAYVSWAQLSEDAEARFLVARRLAPTDWKSGDRSWMIDLISPFGGGEEVMGDLRDNILPGKSFKYWHQGPNGPQVKLVQPLETQADAAAPK
ncbi:toxin-activating lysine-acyltransferase [Ferrovibrio sp.]|uniref:toxin-activating lysine-acyltransferase n=1 Tax=Ferrovibrio sp. TaxID=1917215 RepID=UPI003517E150